MSSPTKTEPTEQGDKTVHSCGASSSRSVGMHLLPYHGLRALAQRFQLGEQKHGHDNWRKGLEDKSYQIERAGHVIDHALKLIAKLEGHLPEDGDDDAGAIAWGGVFLAEAEARRKSQVTPLNCSACSGEGTVNFGHGIRNCPACNGTGKQGRKC